MAAGFGSTLGIQILFLILYMVGGIVRYFFYSSIPAGSRRPVKAPTPKRVRIISHNLWLIPFVGPWCMGRVGRLATRLKSIVAGLGAYNDEGIEDNDEDQSEVLTICAVQEAAILLEKDDLEAIDFLNLLSHKSHFFGFRHSFGVPIFFNLFHSF